MISLTTETPLAIANDLRPVLLRLTRELRKETEQFGITGRQATLLCLDQAEPRPDAARTRRGRGDLAAGALRPHRPARARRAARAGALGGRPPPRRARADTGGRPPPPLDPRAANRLARRAARQRSSRTSSTRSRRRSSRSAAAGGRAREHPLVRAARPHVPQPAPPPQLPPLLRRPGRLARRLVDAEHRARVARPLALALAARRRDAALLPLRPVHRLRALRRLGRRPAGHAPTRHLDAGRGDARLGGARRR